MSAENNISWYVVRTVPRFQIEFEVRHAIAQREHPAMVPFEEKWIQKRDGGWKERKFPLFAGYVFVGLRDKYEFLPLRAFINDLAERMGKVAPILGLIGPTGGQPARLTYEQVERYKQASAESPTEVNIHKALQIGSPIDVFRGPWGGRTSAVLEFTKKGVRGEIELFNSMHIVEFSMRDIRAA